MDIIPRGKPRKRSKDEIRADVEGVAVEAPASAYKDHVVVTNRGMRLLEKLRSRRTRRR